MKTIFGNGAWYAKPEIWSRILVFVLAIGLFTQITGKVWIQSGSARNAQVYLWLLMPSLIFIIFNFFASKIIYSRVTYLPWILFLIWVGLSVTWAHGSDSSSFSLAKRGVFIALYLVSLHILMSLDEQTLRRALYISVLFVSFGALASIVYQFAFLGKPLAYRAYRIDRMGFQNFANFGWPVAAGIFHGSIACWAIGFALERKATRKEFFAWLLVFFILSIYVTLTYTRGAWIALLIGVIFSIASQNSRRGWRLLIAGFLIVSSLILKFWPEIIFELKQRKLSGREPIWDYFFNSMPGHWLTGHGLGSPFNYVWPYANVVSPHAHSLYLQQIYDSGLISLALLLTGLAVVLYKSWKLRDNYWVRLAIPPLMFAIFAMITDVERIYTRPSDYWTVFWLPVAILLAVPYPSKKTAQKD